MQGDDKLKFLRNKSRSEQERVLRADLNRRPDVLWQENPPRVLAYKPSTVHQYGWIPFNPFNARNFKATVFSSPLLNIQSVLLVLWAAFLHGTGCWVQQYDSRAFLKIWGTVFAGAVFNLATIVVFILGLFITLVINRWWSIRTAHAKLVSASSDLTIMVAHSIRDAQDFKNPRVIAARKELVRLINLAHILVCMSGDGANHVFAQRPFVKAVERLFSRGGGAGTREPCSSDDHYFGRHMGALGFQTLNKHGLVNADEWQTILTNDAFGMPRYVTVMYWVEALLHQCRASEYMLTPQQMLPPMLAKVSTIVDNASTIFTFLRSQLPYPYVHLVSFTVHFYLFFWATYMGMLLHTGIPDGSVSQSALTQPLGVGTSADEAWDIIQTQPEVSTAVRHAHRTDGWFNMLWTYLSIAFANVVFQGLLNIHVLLDNPFGDHCSKFPLRSHVVELLNSSRTLLARADMLPQMFTDIFGDGGTAAGAEQPLPSAAADSNGPGSSDGSFTGAAPFAGHVDTVSDLGRLSEQDLAAVAGALIQGTPPSQLLSTGRHGTAGVELQRRSSPMPVRHAATAHRMLYGVGRPELRQQGGDGLEGDPVVTMRRSASASPFATDLHLDPLPPAPKAVTKKPMLRRMSAPFKIQSPSQSSGHISSSRDTTPRTGRGKGIMRSTMSRKAKNAGGAARAPQRPPGQPYVHFRPSTDSRTRGNPADASSEASNEVDPVSGDSAPTYDHRPPQPRSPVVSGPSGPSGVSAMGVVGRSGSVVDASDAAGADGPFVGMAGRGRVAAHVTCRHVEGGVVAEARIQHPREGNAYGAARGARMRRSRSAENLPPASTAPGLRLPAADSVHLKVPPGSAVLRAVQAGSSAGPGQTPAQQGDPADTSATVAFERAGVSVPPGDPAAAMVGLDAAPLPRTPASDSAGRRWFSMFARRSAMRTSSSEGALVHPVSTPVLASMNGAEPVVSTLIGMSANIAQRRVGSQAVFNPTAHVNEDDAQFLRSMPALSNVSTGEPPLEEIREPAQPSGSPPLARTSELADISGSGTQSSLSLPIDKRQVLPSSQKRF